jgi:hypothetical protein
MSISYAPIYLSLLFFGGQRKVAKESPPYNLSLLRRDALCSSKLSEFWKLATLKQSKIPFASFFGARLRCNGDSPGLIRRKDSKEVCAVCPSTLFCRSYICSRYQKMTIFNNAISSKKVEYDAL